MGDTAKQNECDEAKAFRSQLFAGVATGLGGACMMFAMNFPTFGVASMIRDEHFDISSDQTNLVGAIVPLLGLIGNMAAGLLVDRIGRKNTILVGGVLHLVASIFLATCGNISMALVWRAMFGISGSLVMIGGMMYMTEVLHPSHRDRMACVGGVMANAGMLAAFLSGSTMEWRATVWVGALLSIPLLFMVFSLPSTPVFLIKQGKKELAVESLTIYRSSQSEAIMEVGQLLQSNNEEHNSDGVGIGDLFRAPYSRPMSVVVLLLIAQQTTGMPAMTANAVTVFKDFGTTVDPAFCTVMIAIVNIAVTLVGAEIHSRYGRKSTLMVSTMFLVNVLFMLGAYYSLFKFGGEYTEFAQDNRHIPVILMFIYYAAFGIGLGPVPFMYLSEGLPTKIRASATGIAMTINTIVVVGLMMSFDGLVTSLGYTKLFVVLSVLTGILTTIVISMMQETKGLSISDIDNEYDNLDRKLKKKD